MREASAEEIEKANGKGAAKKVEGYFREEEEGEGDSLAGAVGSRRTFKIYKKDKLKKTRNE